VPGESLVVGGGWRNTSSYSIHNRYRYRYTYAYTDAHTHIYIIITIIITIIVIIITMIAIINIKQISQESLRPLRGGGGLWDSAGRFGLL